MENWVFDNKDKENNYVNCDKSEIRKLVEDYDGGKDNGTN